MAEIKVAQKFVCRLMIGLDGGKVCIDECLRRRCILCFFLSKDQPNFLGEMRGFEDMVFCFPLSLSKRHDLVLFCTGLFDSSALFSLSFFGRIENWCWVRSERMM